MLQDEIINSISKGEFHIWTIEKVDDAVEILTGKKAGTRDKQGNFEKGSFIETVENNLRKYYNIFKKTDRTNN